MREVWSQYSYEQVDVTLTETLNAIFFFFFFFTAYVGEEKGHENLRLEDRGPCVNMKR